MNRVGTEAVVIGASMGGLLAARVLSDAYDRVTVFERDVLPDEVANRKGVPQGRHAHGLLPAGLETLEDLFPGLRQGLVDAGATDCGFEDIRFVIGGHRLAPSSNPGRLVALSRALLEANVRDRVRALPNVQIVSGVDVAELLSTDDGSRVTGVRAEHATGEVIDVTADMVVDATGRAGRTPAWLAALGYAPPEEDEVRIDVRYASRHYRLRPGALGSDKLLLIGAVPDLPRVMAMFAIEGDRWIVTLAGYKGHHPPTDPDGFLDFLATVAPMDVYEAILDAEPLDDIVTHRTPSNRRRRYEKLDRFPEGLLVFGDAISSFNPTYGQGMTVAALEALALREWLAGDDHHARAFFKRAAKAVDHAWQTTVGADLALPQVEGPRPLPVRVIGRYMERLIAAAEHDPYVADAFRRVTGMMDRPEALLKPPVAMRVLANSVRRRPSTPIMRAADLMAARRDKRLPLAG
jgi:2-polyprenyl-6-methoxyphenol hydroxylase-like FAD-dependent oxidoreductase